MKNKNPISISFEVFPPNTPQGFEALNQTCLRLNQFNPTFISVTYGAAGSSQLKTVRLVKKLTSLTIPTAPHLSCVGMTKQRLQNLLDTYMAQGVKRLIVIRGDFLTNDDAKAFTHASDLIREIRLRTGQHFHITVAAYPEYHPQSATSQMDTTHFKEKVEAGADSAITQFFFNTDAYSRFRENCAKAGINIPIIPGIMPIQDYNKLLRFSATCGAEIPLWLRKQLDPFSEDHASIQSLGIDLITKQCERVLLDGAEGLHFYTLNQINTTAHIYRNLLSESIHSDYLNFIYAT